MQYIKEICEEWCLYVHKFAEDWLSEGYTHKMEYNIIAPIIGIIWGITILIVYYKLKSKRK